MEVVTSETRVEREEIQLIRILEVSGRFSFPSGSVVKNLPANAGDTKVVGSTPGSERSPKGGNGNPLQYSCLENPIDRGTWQTVGSQSL